MPVIRTLTWKEILPLPISSWKVNWTCMFSQFFLIKRSLPSWSFIKIRPSFVNGYAKSLIATSEWVLVMVNQLELFVHSTSLIFRLLFLLFLNLFNFFSWKGCNDESVGRIVWADAKRARAPIAQTSSASIWI